MDLTNWLKVEMSENNTYAMRPIYANFKIFFLNEYEIAIKKTAFNINRSIDSYSVYYNTLAIIKLPRLVLLVKLKASLK